MSFFNFGGSSVNNEIQPEEDSNQDEVAATSTTPSTASPISPMPDDETPLSESNEAPPGTETSCMHFQVRSKLGWVAWKEREASLYALFERSFAATRCEMKFSESMEEFGFEVEVPNDEVPKFQKFFKSKTLIQEIDYLHGIDPVITKWRDPPCPNRLTLELPHQARLVNLKKTLGSTLKDTNVRSSIEVLNNRFKSLEQVGQARDREVDAIKAQFVHMQTTLVQRLEDIQTRSLNRMNELINSKLEAIQKDILTTIREDLAVMDIELPDPAAKGAVVVVDKEVGVIPQEPNPELVRQQTVIQELAERVGVSDKQYAEAEADRQLLRSRVAAADQQVSALTTERQELDVELRDVRSQLTELQTEHAALRKLLMKSAQIETERDELKKLIEAQKEELTREFEVEKERIQKQIATERAALREEFPAKQPLREVLDDEHGLTEVRQPQKQGSEIGSFAVPVVDIPSKADAPDIGEAVQKHAVDVVDIRTDGDDPWKDSA
ncbi:hypothetical protein BC832DRAFT_539954 [Gaertneriomyces semiglobifer]|nr:hypothetical protein BC832DRAFT_539954 [Gaertneriomyces semiglobifer]